MSCGPAGVEVVEHDLRAVERRRVREVGQDRRGPVVAATPDYHDRVGAIAAALLTVEPETASGRGRFPAIGDLQLGEDVRHVHARGLRRDEQLLADLPIGTARGSPVPAPRRSRTVRPTRSASEAGATGVPRSRFACRASASMRCAIGTKPTVVAIAYASRRGLLGGAVVAHGDMCGRLSVARVYVAFGMRALCAHASATARHTSGSVRWSSAAI